MRPDMTTNDDENIGWVQLMAGTDHRGMPILENLPVKRVQAGEYELLKSPLFVRDLAAGDIFTCEHDNPASYTVLRRSGNLAIRIFRKVDLDLLEQELTPEVEKLGGSLDVKTDRGLAYSLHVNIGFADIERLFDGIMANFIDAVWYYGNIYDREDGTTPLYWWDDFLDTV